mmetsp:Transcript_1410/g.4058  ORF Transcript_1410/g.4058 Transcript_1410/m.4058 type:complete len:228 (-) Transcript_1410:195-878(-)
MGPLGLQGPDVAVRLVVDQEVPPDGGLIPGQDDLGLPLRAEVLLHPLVLLLGALGVEVRVGGRHEEDVVASGGHGLDGLDAALHGLHLGEEPGGPAHGLDLVRRGRGVVLGNVPVQAPLRGHQGDLGELGLHARLERALPVTQGVVHVHQDRQLVPGVVVLGLGLRHHGEPLRLLHLGSGGRHKAVRGRRGQSLGVARQVRRHRRRPLKEKKLLSRASSSSSSSSRG